MGPSALLSRRRKECCGFLSLLKSIASAGFEPSNFESNGKHSNRYTTEATRVCKLLTNIILFLRRITCFSSGLVLTNTHIKLLQKIVSRDMRVYSGVSGPWS
jgi:hypothetical protein